MNVTEAYRRDGGVVILKAFSSLAALKVFTMKISSAAAGASWRWDDGICISANNLWALDEITHTDTWTVAPLVYTVKSLFYVLIPYVFHFKYFSYEYCSNFWVLRV